MSVDEYTREFEKLLIKCDIQELEEQTIVRYLRGLEPRYSNIVELEQYSTFSEVCVLTHKVGSRKGGIYLGVNFLNHKQELHPSTRGVRTSHPDAWPCSRPCSSPCSPEPKIILIPPFHKTPQPLKKPIHP